MDIIRFCMFGQVDVGKSTISGHFVKATGNLDEHEFEKIKEKCTKDKALNQLYSRVLDITDEEQIKGKTHEYSILEFTYKETNFELLDTPGHKAFIRELINCISQFEVNNKCDVIGCCLLSAKEGEFQAGWIGGQTKEDLIIAKSLGIEDLVVIVNKLDTLSSDKERQEKFDKLTSTVKPFLRDVCKFKTLSFIPVSGYQGLGLVEKYPSFEETSISFYEALLEAKKSFSSRWLEKDEYTTWNFESDSHVIDLRVIQCENIICPGYQCIIHYIGKEYECTIERIKGKKFLKSKESGICKVKLSQPLKLTNARRVLVRNASLTIGYGVIQLIASCSGA